MQVPAGWEAARCTRRFGTHIAMDFFDGGKADLCFGAKSPLFPSEFKRFERINPKEAEAIGFAAQTLIETIEIVSR